MNELTDEENKKIAQIKKQIIDEYNERRVIWHLFNCRSIEGQFKDIDVNNPFFQVVVHITFERYRISGEIWLHEVGRAIARNEIHYFVSEVTTKIPPKENWKGEITPDLLKSIIMNNYAGREHNCLILVPQSFMAHQIRHLEEWKLRFDRKHRRSTIFRSPAVDIISIPKKEFQDRILILEKSIVNPIFKVPSKETEENIFVEIDVFKEDNTQLFLYANSLIQWNINKEMLDDAIWIKCEQKENSFYLAK